MKNLLKIFMVTSAVMLMTSSASYAAVKIAIAGPHTGPFAAFGEQLWRGSAMAASDINAAGGINGEKIVLVKADDACEPKQAVAVANKSVDQDEVIAVIGHFCSSSTIPASEIYDEAGILQMTPASTNPGVTERGLPNIFRMCGRDDQQGIVAGNFLVNDLKAKRVAVIHDKDTYGQGLADATKARMNELGVKEALYEGLTRGEKDFNALVTKIKSVKADAVYFGGLHAEAGPLVRQMREQGLDIPFVSGDGIVSQDFVKAAGGAQFTDGVYMTFGKNPLGIKAGQAVIKKFRELGYEPEGYTLYSYATMQAVAAALTVGKLDSNRASDYLKSAAVSTVLGNKSWDSKGDLKVSDYVIYRWKGATYDEI